MGARGQRQNQKLCVGHHGNKHGSSLAYAAHPPCSTCVSVERGSVAEVDAVVPGDVRVNPHHGNRRVPVHPGVATHGAVNRSRCVSKNCIGQRNTGVRVCNRGPRIRASDFQRGIDHNFLKK